MPEFLFTACDVGADARLPLWPSSCLLDRSVPDHLVRDSGKLLLAGQLGPGPLGSAVGGLLESSIRGVGGDARLQDRSVFQLSEHSRHVPATDDRGVASLKAFSLFCSRRGQRSYAEYVSAETYKMSHCHVPVRIPQPQSPQRRKSWHTQKKQRC